MLSDAEFIGVLFRFTIFSLLSIKILQLVRGYVVPYLVEEIKKEKALRTELIEKENFVKSTQSKVENQIRTQNKLFVDLEKNVQRWHAQISKDADQANRKLLEIKVQIERKRNIQNRNYALKTAYSTAIPSAIDLTKKDLENIYLAKDGDNAFNKLVESL